MWYARQMLRREIARRFLIRRFGDDRSFLAAGEDAFAYVQGREIITVAYSEVSDDVRLEAESILRHEQSVA